MENVTSYRAQDSWNTTPLLHNQSIRRKSQNLQPSPQILPIKNSPHTPSGSLFFSFFFFGGGGVGISHVFSLIDPMDCSTPAFPVYHQLPVLTQTHIYRVGDVIQLSHPLLSPSLPAFNLSQHQDLFQ